MKSHKNNASLLADARRSLLGHLRVAVWSTLLFMTIQMFLNNLPRSFSFRSSALTLVFTLAAQAVTTIFVSLFGVGLSGIFLNLQYGQPAKAGDLFICFRENQDTSIRVRSFVTIGELAAVLPLQLTLYFLPAGNVLSYTPFVAPVAVLCLAALVFWRISFAMTNYVLLDFPEMDAGRILRTARSMMRGNRPRYFFLMLRILPLYLLSALSLGLTTLWTSSYQQAAAAAFYRDLLDSAERKAQTPE